MKACRSLLKNGSEDIKDEYKRFNYAVKRAIKKQKRNEECRIISWKGG